jgi:hypothetical protein
LPLIPINKSLKYLSGIIISNIEKYFLNDLLEIIRKELNNLSLIIEIRAKQNGGGG